MKLTKSKLEQLVKEELENVLYEQEEQKYRLTSRAFCRGGQCRGDARIINVAEGSTVFLAASGMGKTKEEAMLNAKTKLTNKLKAKGLDINKIKIYNN